MNANRNLVALQSYQFRRQAEAIRKLVQKSVFVQEKELLEDVADSLEAAAAYYEKKLEVPT